MQIQNVITQASQRKNKTFEIVSRDIEARVKRERDEPRKRVFDFHLQKTRLHFHIGHNNKYLPFIHVESSPSALIYSSLLIRNLCADDVCGQGSQRDSQHQRSRFENRCKFQLFLLSTVIFRTSATELKDSDPLWKIVFMDDRGWKWTPIEVEQKNNWDQLND